MDSKTQTSVDKSFLNDFIVKHNDDDSAPVSIMRRACVRGKKGSMKYTEFGEREVLSVGISVYSLYIYK